jgi:hypothetical protein
LGHCGSHDSGLELRNVAKAGQTPYRAPKRVDKTPKTPKGAKPKPQDDPTEEDESASGSKNLAMCAVGNNKRLKLNFPNYPTSGDIIKHPGTWKSEIDKVYNAKDIDPCHDNYELGESGFPQDEIEGLYTPRKPKKTTGGLGSKDIWQTEHVMDAQIVKRFLMDTFEVKNSKVKQNEIPKDWVSGPNDSTRSQAKAATRTTCDYLVQFWQARWTAPVTDKTGNACKYNWAYYD